MFTAIVAALAFLAGWFLGKADCTPPTAEPLTGGGPGEVGPGGKAAPKPAETKSGGGPGEENPKP